MLFSLPWTFPPPPKLATSHSPSRSQPNSHFLCEVFCCRLNVCVPLNFTCLSLNPQYDDIRRWVLWKVIRSFGGSSHEGISTLIKEAPENSLTPSTCEDIARRWPSVNQEVGPHQTQYLLVP